MGPAEVVLQQLKLNILLKSFAILVVRAAGPVSAAIMTHAACACQMNLD